MSAAHLVRSEALLQQAADALAAERLLLDGARLGGELRLVGGTSLLAADAGPREGCDALKALPVEEYEVRKAAFFTRVAAGW
ncbi:hypothetical protein [Quadrisphaera sp. KR29]|uniref:hypothetical protein n=1 Tax=Quadrisphaera sp. KR29 TaxID=3461391 RepID=UPI00404456D5